MKHISTVSAYHQFLGEAPPHHPLASIFRMKLTKLPEPKTEFTGDFYTITLANIVAGHITYGRTKYDFNNGVLIFMAPDQKRFWKEVKTATDAITLTFHKDFIVGTQLESSIKKYGFFSYAVNEALHLSSREERTLKNILSVIETEYKNNQDEFSRNIMISHIDSLLQYANRYYKRQFINRSIEANTRYSKLFREALEKYYQITTKDDIRFPTIESIASELKLSARYLSDLLKLETGKTAIEHIHLYIVDKAKEKLIGSDYTVAEISQSLGFEYPQYFSKLFKKIAGVSPNEFRGTYTTN